VPLPGRKRRDDPPSITLRDILLASVPLEKVATSSQGFSGDPPWSHFAAAHWALRNGDHDAAIQQLRRVVQMEGLEARVHLQAWHSLRELGEQAPPDMARTLHGVVVEVGLKGGLDLVAAYSDYSARYYNYSGAGVVWERPRGDAEIDQLVDLILQSGQVVVDNSGPWRGAAPSPPPEGRGRINLLTPGGLHFGEGNLDQMSKDPVGGRIISLALALMQTLIGKHHDQQR
jgi:hypothetical protein